MQPQWAEAVGLDPGQFEGLLDDEQLHKQLKMGKMEGLENGVEATPAYYIDGIAYGAELELEEIVDVTEELWDRSQGLVYEPEPQP